MFLGGGIFGLALLALWAYCIFDVIRTDERSVQNLPKMFWLVIVILIPSIGSIAWLLLGRPSGIALRPDGARLTRRPESPPPVTEPTGQPFSSGDHQMKREEALRKYNEEREAKLREQEEQLRRREEELQRREQEDGSA